MSLRTISSLGPLTGKTVIVRCDLNVPMSDGEITDDGRIRASIPTLRELIDAKIEGLGDWRREVLRRVRALIREVQHHPSRPIVLHLDLYQVHAWDPLTPVEETLSWFDDAVRGLTRLDRRTR